MLRSILAKLDGERILWIEQSRSMTVAEVFHRVSTNDYQNLRGCKAAVALSPSMDSLVTLVSLDGICRNILLIPISSLPRQRKMLLQEFGADVLIEGRIVRSCKDTVFDSGKCEDRAVATRWVIPTSGTTGTPKLVSHTFRSLTKSMKATQLDTPLSWGLLYDLSRFAGLQVFLNCLLTGSPLILTGEALPLSERLELLQTHNCTALSATPSMWRKIVMIPSSQHLQLRQITLGGEIADQKVLNTLRARYPNAKIVHIYASTEAGACFSVKDGVAGFPAAYITNPPAGVELRIADDQVLWIRPSTHDQRYLNSDKNVFDVDGFINTGDIVTKSGDRYHFAGRVNGTINVGGDKVLPEEVETALLSIPYVRQARVYGKQNAFLGAVVAADVVMDMAKGTRESILSELARLLPANKIPATLNIVSDLHLSSAGKKIRLQ
jgi:acyl-CoA synthetase (AMP-forming)/AMP-acid ligase II